MPPPHFFDMFAPINEIFLHAVCQPQMLSSSMPQIAPDAVSEHENTQKYLAPLDNVIRYLNVAPPPLFMTFLHH